MANAMTRKVGTGDPWSKYLGKIPDAFAVCALLLIAPPVSAQLRVLHSFNSLDPVNGDAPLAGLTQARDGNLYGTTSGERNAWYGAAFELSKDTNGAYTVLTSLHGLYDSEAGLLEASDGNLYGVSLSPPSGTQGPNGYIFELSKDGSGAYTVFTLLHVFAVDGSDGANPYATLMQGSDGNLYGTTLNGGSSSDAGTVFRLSKDGTGAYTVFTLLHAFAGGAADGATPYASLIQGSDGNLYGTTAHGGNSDSTLTTQDGTVYRLSKDGTGAYTVFTLLHAFAGGVTDGATPYASLIEGSDGNLYGTTYHGGSSDIALTAQDGTVFSLSKDGTGAYTVFTLLHAFAGGATDGANPYASLIQGSDGNLYGTTWYGGDQIGTIFELFKDGAGTYTVFTLLHTFVNSPTDGYFPNGSLLQGSDGNFYGTTIGGGTFGYGTVFELPSRVSVTRVGLGTVTSSPPGIACAPTCSYNFGNKGPVTLTASAAPDFVFTGWSGAGCSGTGTCQVFSSPNTNVTATFALVPEAFRILHTFTGNTSIGVTDGANPEASLIEGNDGNLYGTTYEGGGPNGVGTVFELSGDSSGAYTVLTLLHTFTGGSNDGAYPRSNLIQASDGNLYGTTSKGGSFDSGTVYELSKDSTGNYTIFTLLHRFTGAATDGANPYGALLQGSDGNLYGTTFRGGSSITQGVSLPNSGFGTVFELSKDGSGAYTVFSLLHSFPQVYAVVPGVGNVCCSYPDGASPTSSLIEGSDGNLYGAASVGGNLNGGGTVFQLSKDAGAVYDVFTQLYSFPPLAVGFQYFYPSGYNPAGSLVQG